MSSATALFQRAWIVRKDYPLLAIEGELSP
jgi:hypothetical protein